MQNTIKFILIASVLFISSGCTEQQMARSFGGTSNAEIPCGHRLEGITWKSEMDLWLQYRPFREGEEPEIHYFRQSAGTLVRVFDEGTVVIRESVCPVETSQIGQ